jgi:hypothetical protein
VPRVPAAVTLGLNPPAKAEGDGDEAAAKYTTDLDLRAMFLGTVKYPG